MRLGGNYSPINVEQNYIVRNYNVEIIIWLEGNYNGHGQINVEQYYIVWNYNVEIIMQLLLVVVGGNYNGHGQKNVE